MVTKSSGEISLNLFKHMNLTQKSRRPCRMPKPGPRIIKDYLVPNLNKGTFGKNLQWIKKDENIFQIMYKHKNSSNWTEADAAVFVEWDRLKDPERHRPHEEEYYTLARQRLKAAIHKLTLSGFLRRINFSGNFMAKRIMFYQILTGSEREKHLTMRSMAEKLKERHKTTGETINQSAAKKLCVDSINIAVERPCDCEASRVNTKIWDYACHKLSKDPSDRDKIMSHFRRHTEERLFSEPATDNDNDNSTAESDNINTDCKINDRSEHAYMRNGPMKILSTKNQLLCCPISKGVNINTLHDFIMLF